MKEVFPKGINLGEINPLPEQDDAVVNYIELPARARSNRPEGNKKHIKKGGGAKKGKEHKNKYLEYSKVNNGEKKS